MEIPLSHFQWELRADDNRHGLYTGATLLENNEAPAKLSTANGGTFTASSACRLSSQSRDSTLHR